LRTELDGINAEYDGKLRTIEGSYEQERRELHSTITVLREELETAPRPHS